MSGLASSFRLVISFATDQDIGLPSLRFECSRFGADESGVIRMHRAVQHQLLDRITGVSALGLLPF